MGVSSRAKFSQLQKMFNGILILAVSIVVTTLFSIVHHEHHDQNYRSAMQTSGAIESPSQRMDIERQLSALKLQLKLSAAAEKALIESNNQLQELREEIQQLHEAIKGKVAQSPPSSHLEVVSKKPKKPAKFAMVYVIGGVDPRSASYMGYVYDVVASAYTMRADGSKADVFIFFQMAYESPWNSLRDSDIELLEKMDIKYEYIPKQEDESFDNITMQKFRILTLTQYKRVLFMDGDVLARRNLDYLCELSYSGVLQENVVMAGRQEPANAGLFVLTPKEGAFERIGELIAEKNKRVRDLPYPHWDPVIGWGHQITPPDYFEKITEVKNNSWDFHCAFSDQGLLYHWVKYEQKSVSIFFNRHIQNWAADENGEVRIQHTHHLMHTLSQYVKPDMECWKGNMQGALCRPPFSDFVHYTGKSKPWLQAVPEGLSNATALESSLNYWFFQLIQANEKHSLDIDFDNWKGLGRPTLGMYAKHSTIAKAVQKPSA